MSPAKRFSTCKWVDDANSGIREIGTVSSSNREPMDGRGRRDEAIFDRHGLPGYPKPREQFRPFQSCVRVPRQAVETPNSFLKPAFQGSPLSANCDSEFSFFGSGVGLVGSTRSQSPGPARGSAQ